MSDVATGVPEVVPTQTVVQTTEITSAQKYHQPKRDKQCSVCGESFTPSVGFQKRCPLHLTPPGTDQYRVKNAAEAAKSRSKKVAQESAAARKYNSKTEITQKEAIEILEKERLVRNPHVVITCVELAERAARHLKIPFNVHLMTHGLRLTLQAIETKKQIAPLDIQPEEIDGEVIHRTDVFALFDYGFWRQPNVGFEQWLADRRRFKSSAFELSKLLGKEDFGSKHEDWTSFAPRWNPLGLKPSYTQKQALTWLDAQQSDTEGDKKRFLLVASRNSMKSTWARIHALALTITYPDARILIVSETNKLSKKAMKEFRGYLEMAPNSPTLFQQYFGEYTIAPDSGQSLIYDNPLAHLGLPQNSVESSSMESANTGSRFDYCVFDDPISRDNGTANDEQRAAAVSKHGSIMKLREPAGFAINIQTPWVVGDLGDVMIKRNEEDSERPLAVRIDSVMDIRPEAAKTPLLQLKEEDVVLNFLPKLNWKFVRDEMRSPEGITFFRTQYMTEWVNEDDQIKVTFTMEQLQAAIRVSVPESQRVMRVISLDSAFSVAKTADFSCLVCADILRHKDRGKDRDVVFVHSVKLERLKTSELGALVAEFLNEMKPDRVIAERTGDWVSLQDAIRRAALLRGYMPPEIFWKPVSNVAGAPVPVKVARAKGMEPLLADGRLLFSVGIPVLENCFQQMVHFDGIKRSGSSPGSKDDFVDALSLLISTWAPREINEPVSDAQLEYEQQVYEQSLRRGDYNRIFGSPVAPQKTGPIYTPPPEDNNGPFERAGFSKFGFTRKAA